MKLSAGEKAVFFRQLATLLDSAYPLTGALDLLRKQFSGKKMGRALQMVSKEIAGGTSLYEALAKFPGFFSPFILALIRAGESSGNLPAALNDLAAIEEENKEFNAKLVGMLLYPALLLLLSLVVFPLFLLIQPHGQEKYFHTVAVSLLLVTVIGLAAYFFRKIYTPGPVPVWLLQKFLLGIPGLGSLLKQRALYNFLQTLGYLEESGFPRPQAFELAAKACGSLVLEKNFLALLPRIEKGESLTQTLSAERKLMPVMLVQMLVAGETAGQLPGMLKKCARVLADEIQHKTKILLTLLSFLVMLGIGIYIGIRIILFYLNFFQQELKI